MCIRDRAMTALTALDQRLKNFSNTAPKRAQSSVQRKPVTERMTQKSASTGTEL